MGGRRDGAAGSARGAERLRHTAAGTWSCPAVGAGGRGRGRHAAGPARDGGAHALLAPGHVPDRASTTSRPSATSRRSRPSPPGSSRPFATLVLVALTLFGALPVYRRVAGESFRGEGSIAMLERLLPWWGGKLFVLVLLGFAATDFMITITLSAADAAAHAVENPLMPAVAARRAAADHAAAGRAARRGVPAGFREAIGIAVVLVAVYLALNAVVDRAASFTSSPSPGSSATGRSRAAAAERRQPAAASSASRCWSSRSSRSGSPASRPASTVIPQIRGGERDTPGRARADASAARNGC